MFGQHLGYIVSVVALFTVFTKYWDEPSKEGYYSTTAQVIATMYVAVAVEFFGEKGGVRLNRLGRLEFLSLLALSWLGLLLSMRALDGHTRPWTSSFAASGVVASVFLVTTSLGRLVRPINPELARPIVYLAGAAPVVIFLIP
jgi:hypothetical protein